MNKAFQLGLKSFHGKHDKYMAAVPALTKDPESVWGKLRYAHKLISRI